MIHLLEYHNDKSTIEASQQQRAEFIAQHRDKWLTPWPEQVRAEVDSYIDQNLDLIYGHIEYLVKPIPQDNKGYAAWLHSLEEHFGGQVVHAIETPNDKTWVRLAFHTEDEANQAKATIQ